jgi:hypothetical protein
MKILITENPNKTLASELSKLYPESTFVSREAGTDLTTSDGHKKLAELSINFDVFINCSALWQANYIKNILF